MKRTYRLCCCVRSDPNRQSTFPRRSTSSSSSSSSSSDAGTEAGTWPIHSPAGREYRELNSRYVGKTASTGSVGRGPRISECAFWTQYLPDHVNFTDTGTYHSPLNTV